MIIQDEVNNVFRSGVIQNTSFKIKSSAKAFKLLSSGVYTDKITAIIRELTCNGVDAHSVASKSDVPVLIHLPNDFEPFFSIRDYGTGISPTDMTTVYTTYFESTKTQSNDEVGCFGIGGKSPYSYCDNFTVTSFFNGEKRVYSAYLNEKGEPDLAELAVCPTDESNGLEVSFAVDAKDFCAFNSKLTNTLKYFPVRPTVVGAEVSFPTIEYKFKRNNWGLISGINNRAKAIMGNVCYPLYDYTGTDLTPSEKALLNLNIDVFFPIGTLDVALSREHLSYDEVTKKNIKTTLENIVIELREEINKEIIGCKTLWDAKLFFNELKSGSYSHFKDVLKGLAFDWNGTKIEDNFIKIKDINEAEYAIYSKRGDVYRRGKRRSNYTGEFKETSDGIFANTGVVFFKNDLKKNGIKHRLDKYLRDVKMDAVIVLVKEKVKDGIEAFKQQVGLAQDTVFGLVSALPVDSNAVAQDVYNPKSRVSVLRFEGLHDATPSAPWVVEKIDESLGGIYIPIHHYQEVTTNNCAKTYVIRQFKLLDAIGVSRPVVYGVKPKGMDNMLKRSNWKTLKDYVNEEYRKYAITNKLQEKYNLFKAHEDFFDLFNNTYDNRNIGETTLKIFEEYSKELNTSGKHSNFMLHFREFKKINNTIINIFNMGMSDVNIKDDAIYNPIYKEFVDTFDLFATQAPMLKYVKSWNVAEPEVKKYLTDVGLI